MIDLADLRAKAEAATPGPWRLEENTTLVWGNCNPDDTTSYGMGYPVAESVGRASWSAHGGRPFNGEREANAAYIAALHPATALALIDMAEAIMFIAKRARSDGDRTFDDCIRDLGWIDDECRRVTPPPPDAKEG